MNVKEIFIMNLKNVKREETLIEQELTQLAAKFPNWNFGYELNTTITNAVEVVKKVIKEIKLKYPKYKFSICKNSYNSLLILNIKSTDKDEEFAYYGGNNVGYVVCNTMYRTIINEFTNHSDIKLLDIRVFEYIENSKTMQLEFKQF
jgi:hypothetical protein